ncbi:PHP domain-containing protein [Brucella melitensis]|nr:PHP domain-containing protein [Brucella melitensis]
MNDTVAGNAASGSSATPGFVHLRVHSAYSLLEGALPLGKIIKQALADEAPAIAVTDTNNLFGALEFAQKASKDGVQPIIGCQLDVAFGDHNDNSRSVNRKLALDLAPLVLIAATEAGYANIVRLVSRAFLDTPAGDPIHIEAGWLPALSEDVIALTGGPLGPIGRSFTADRADRARARLAFLKETFGNRLYVELQRQAGYDRTVEASTVELAYEMDLPLSRPTRLFS